ncbi:MAG: diguanylate cyclase [Gammaproteobacteria bacterium]|nr:diguanylate cyclase [Gammaproteobacteria bacterium]
MLNLGPAKETFAPSILLVEDSPTTAALLSKYLAGSYRLLHAKDGIEAWELLQKSTEIELVITDINMPRLTGHQLLVRIRKSEEPRFKNLPVIVMTTTDDTTDRNLAFLNGANDFITKPIDEMELQARVHVHHKLAHTIRELEASRRALAEQATTDPLTKLKNRRAFFDNGSRQLAMARRYGTDLSILVLDLDYFKRINDSFGHQAGDEALVTVAHILSQMTRTEDTVARTGGEEFAVLLPDTNRLGAAVLAERIRAAVQREQFAVEDQQVILTLSIGVASYNVEQTDTLDQLLNVADQRMYLAKKNGRNRICVNNEGKANFAAS